MNDIDIKIKKEKLIQTIKTVISPKNIRTIENSILDKNDAFLSYLFAKEIEGANIDKHLEVVASSKDYQTIYSFAMEVECDKTMLVESIKNSGIAKWMYFVTYAKGVDATLLEDAILNTDDLRYIFNFALNTNCNRSKFIRKIVESNNLDYISQLGKLGVKSEERNILIKQVEDNTRKLKK